MEEIFKKIKDLLSNKFTAYQKIIILFSFAIILLINIFFGFKMEIQKFFKPNMKMSFLEIQNIFEYYNRYTENEVRNTTEELAKIIKAGTWAVQGMHNKKIYEHPATVENWHFQSRILYLKEYDYENKLVVDVRHKRKDKSLVPISHDTKTIEFNKPRFFTTSSDIEYTENYIEDGGENVETMFGQFWFNVYIKGGATYAEPESSSSLRSVILLDKPAFDSIEGTKTQKEKILKQFAEKLRDDQVKGVIIEK